MIENDKDKNPNPFLSSPPSRARQANPPASPRTVSASPPRRPYGSPTRPSPPGRGTGSPLSPRPQASPWFDEGDIESRAAGFQADSVRGPDRLNIRGEALTLAMVLAHKDVEPPISVGLFGDWGSGKSFFMSEMRKLIAKLSDQSRASGGGRFCENVIQLEFNAWHYMDSNLWASLAREIFEGLATAMADRKNPDLNLERERVRAARRSTKDLIAATEVQVVDVQRKLDETERRLTGAREERASVEDVARATVAAVLRTPEVEQKLRTVASDLHLDEARQSVVELKEQLDQLGAVAKLGRALATAFAERWKGLALGLVIVLLGALMLFLIMRGYNETVAETVSRLVIVIGGLTTALATIGRHATAVFKRAGEFLSSLDENVTRQRDVRTREIEAERARLDQELPQLEEQRARHAQELERLNTLLARLDSSSRQLVDFIRQRDASSDYRAQLGTVARASQDFKRLSDLMARAAAARKRKAANTPEPGDEEDAALPQIDRIVLYIDDLDRCPEKKVVDVLQAVHLLLAYPLFVVVVGVDPSWLLHSLEQHSGAFRTSPEPGGSDDASGEWRSTSLNYLEKIFQIPYTLRRMDADGFKRLVDDLSSFKGQPAPVSPLSPPIVMASPSPPPVPQPSPAAPLTAVEPIEEELDPNPAALELDERERLFMPRLHELIPTPRAAKRFVNVYRLIRASIRTEYELYRFLEDREFAAVQVLLAMVSGAPTEAAEILQELLRLPQHGNWNLRWWDLVDRVVSPRLDQPAWRRLAKQLRSLRGYGDTNFADDIPLDCEGFRKWADDVARYSFYSGRALLGLQQQQDT